jgi:hypothetical protein
MNDRIKELAEEAVLSASATYSQGPDEIWLKEYNKKFAELIVKECAQACINEGKTYAVESAGQYQSNLYATAIKKHFGVEE